MLAAYDEVWDGKPIELRFDAAKEFNSFTVAMFVNPNDWRYVEEDERQTVIEKILYDGHVIVQQLRKVTSISPLTIWENFFGYLLWHYHILLSNPGLADQAMEDIEILEDPKTWAHFSNKSWWAQYTGGLSPTNLVNVPVRKSCCFFERYTGINGMRILSNEEIIARRKKPYLPPIHVKDKAFLCYFSYTTNQSLFSSYIDVPIKPCFKSCC
ncbi:hypothetical protein OL548_07580 [Lysinibacillus sp. MHQ-1]|nr:hypothetical protein OL548_07580 [Lysinibacillus sp. MHQ-1]